MLFYRIKFTVPYIPFIWITYNIARDRALHPYETYNRDDALDRIDYLKQMRANDSRFNSRKFIKSEIV